MTFIIITSKNNHRTCNKQFFSRIDCDAATRKYIICNIFGTIFQGSKMPANVCELTIKCPECPRGLHVQYKMPFAKITMNVFEDWTIWLKFKLLGFVYT